MAANQEQDFLTQAAALVVGARSATLATIADAHHPYASLVTPALDPDGAILLLLSDLAVHTRHLRADPACALMIVGAPLWGNPQTSPRITLTATAQLSADQQAKKNFLATHPYADLYINFADFHIWELTPVAAHFIGGFAAASQLDVAALHKKIIGQRIISSD